MATQTRIKPEDLTLLTELLAQNTRPSAGQESPSPSGTVVGNGWIKTAQGLIPPARNLKDRDFSGQDLRGQTFVQKNLSNANFRGAILKGCDFSGSDLSFADFTDTDLYRANFTNARLYTTSFRGSDLTRANFTNAYLYGIKLFNADVTRSIFDHIVKEEKIAKSHEEFGKACDVYNTLKRSFKEHGEIEISARYYYRQRLCQRKSNHNPFSRLLNLVFLDWLVGYGEKPARSIYWTAVLIVIFALVYILLPNFSLGSVSNQQSNPETLIDSIYHFPLALEFSIAAFSGADLGGWEVKDVARLLISLEALSGIIMMSIVIIGFSRKLVRD